MHADQHQDHDLKLFFMRVEWDLADFDLSEDEFRQHFTPLAEGFGMDWRITYSDHRPAMVGSESWRQTIQPARQMEFFAPEPSVFSGQL